MSKLGLRFALEVVFLLAVAVVAALLELGWVQIVAVMGAAWLLTTLVEWLSARGRQESVLRPRAEPPPPVPAFGEGIVAVGPVARRAVREAEPQPAAEREPEPEPAVAAVPPPVVPELELAPPEPLVVARPEPQPELEAEAAPESEPEPERAAPPEPAPVAVAPPSPASAPAPTPVPAAAAATAAAAASVVPLGAPSAPREWNLWELERLVREHPTGDPLVDEERAFLLVYLRDFASANGVLPVDFDGLVRESFGDLLGL